MATDKEWPPTRLTLIGELQANLDGPAWTLFVEIYGPLIYRFCRRRGIQDADAKDVSQNVFLAVRRGIRRFQHDPSRGKFRSWLGTIASREIYRFREKHERAGHPTLDATDGSLNVPVSDAVWIVEFNQHICEMALNRIKLDFEEATWNAFELLWKQDLKPSDVARMTDKPADWVYQVKYRVMKRLEKEILHLSADIPSLNMADL